jgi:hypothetical protein
MDRPDLLELGGQQSLQVRSLSAGIWPLALMWGR